MVTPVSPGGRSEGGGENGNKADDYYATGNAEITTETALTVNRLEPVSSSSEGICFRIRVGMSSARERFSFLQ